MFSNTEYSVCPYNNSHRIANFRMAGHLIKCEKSYNGPPLEMCPFNAMHRLPKENMPSHIANDCKDYLAVLSEKHREAFRTGDFTGLNYDNER